MEYHKDFKSISGEWTYLESSYVTGLSLENSTIKIWGEFCLSIEDSIWKNGFLQFSNIQSSDIKLNGNINAAKNGELDLRSPEIHTSRNKAKIMLDIGEINILGEELSISLTLEEKSDG